MKSRLIIAPSVLLLLALAPLLMAPGLAGCPDCLEDISEVDQPTNTELQYSFAVTGGQRYDIILRPSVGDVDLYSNDSDPVSQSQWDCRPLLAGSKEEVCTITPTSSGTQYLMVHVYSGDADFNLWVIESDTGCHSGSAGSTSHCSASCTCGYELGNCDSDAECGGGLKCTADVGASYGFSTTTDVCL